MTGPVIVCSRPHLVAISAVAESAVEDLSMTSISIKSVDIKDIPISTAMMISFGRRVFLDCIVSIMGPISPLVKHWHI